MKLMVYAKIMQNKKINLSVMASIVARKYDLIFFLPVNWIKSHILLFHSKTIK